MPAKVRKWQVFLYRIYNSVEGTGVSYMNSSYLYIYHSNDFHSHFQQWPYIAHMIKKQRKIHKQKQEDMLYFDIGDHADRFHPITEATEGAASTVLLNEIKVDAITIGNNEGMTFSKQQLERLYEKRNFPVLVANLFEVDGTRPSWVKPYEFFTLSNGAVVGVIGMTIAYYPFYEKLGWVIKDPLELLPSLIQEVRQKAHIVVLLSHLGLNLDEEIADKIEGIDVIIGGHTHQLLKSGKNVKGTRIAQAGKYGHFLGQIMIEIDNEHKEIVRMEIGTIEIQKKDYSQETMSVIQQLEKQTNDILNEEIAYIEEPLEINWYKDSKAAQFLAEALREWCGTEISMVNSGVILESLPKGAITKGDIHRICPHPINPCVVTIQGNQLKETIHHAFTEEMKQLALKGYGFRGKILGHMVFAGIDVEVKRLEDQLDHVTNILINNQPIDYEKMYQLATLDMFTFGMLYPGIASSPKKEYFMPELLRDVFLWKIQSMK